MRLSEAVERREKNQLRPRDIILQLSEEKKSIHVSP